jgi:hypothetical protein
MLIPPSIDTSTPLPRLGYRLYGAIFFKEVTRDAVAFGDVDKIGLEANQPARRDGGLDEHVVGLCCMLTISAFRPASDWRMSPRCSPGTST